MSTSTSIYKSQLHGRDFRLIHLHPGKSDSIIECTLVEASLCEGEHQGPVYDALSYVWGDANITEPIICNGVMLRVTTNLASALRRIRQGVSGLEDRKAKVRTCATIPDSLWVDAICINQSLLAERNHQVTLMKDIFAGASRVLVWLGDAEQNPEDSRKALQAVYYRRYRSDNLYTADLPGEQWCDVLNSALHSAWFGRVWCVQEFALAREARFLFHGGDMTFDEMMYYWHEIDGWPAWKHLHILKNLDELFARRVLIGFYQESPLYVLKTHGHLDATDQRDRVYGLLGLVGMSQIALEIDYSKSLLTVLVDTVVWLIQYHRSLRVLTYAARGKSDSAIIRDLPSWVPTWLSSATADFRRPEFDEAYDSAGRRTAPVVDFSRCHEGILRVQGLLCDHVTYSGIFPFSPESREGAIEISEIGKWKSLQTVAATLTGGYVAVYARERFDIETRMTDREISELDQCNRWVLSTPILALNVPATLDGNLKSSSDSEMDHSRDGLSLGTFKWQMLKATYGRRLFRTSRGWIGLGPEHVSEGDAVAIFDDGSMPFILRPADTEGRQHTLIGDCFIHDIAIGQAYDIARDEGLEERMFDLI